MRNYNKALKKEASFRFQVSIIALIYTIFENYHNLPRNVIENNLLLI